MALENTRYQPPGDPDVDEKMLVDKQPEGRPGHDGKAEKQRPSRTDQYFFDFPVHTIETVFVGPLHPLRRHTDWRLAVLDR